MEKLNISSIAERVKSETPIFWKKVRTLMLTIGGIGTAIKAGVAAEMFTLPTGFDPEYINWAILIGVIGTTLASLTAQPAEQK